MRMTGLSEMTQRRDGTVECMEEPVVRDVHRKATGLQTVRRLHRPGNCGALFCDHFEQARYLQHECIACAGAKRARHKLGVVEELVIRTANDTCNGNGEHFSG